MAADVCGTEVEAWVVCLLGGCAEEPALESEAGVCRKAAKNVERKKGRCEDMSMREAPCAAGGSSNRCGPRALLVVARGAQAVCAAKMRDLLSPPAIVCEESSMRRLQNSFGVLYFCLSYSVQLGETGWACVWVGRGMSVHRENGAARGKPFRRRPVVDAH